jgi:hypothetical protein
LTASNSATLDFTGLSGYTKYLIIFENILPVTSGPTQNLNLRFGTGGGPTYITSNYSYTYIVSSTGGGVAGGGTTGSLIFLATNLYNAGIGVNGSLFVDGMLSGYTTSQGTFYNSSSAIAWWTHISGGGNYSNTTAKTALRFFITSGNILSGTASLYGIAS